MTDNSERMQKASTTLATMLDYLGLDAKVKAEEKEGKIALMTYSEEAGRIIGKKGQSLQSLELLVNRMMTKDDIDCPWITIDVDGYSSKSMNKKNNSSSNFKKKNVQKPKQKSDQSNEEEDDDNSEILQKMATDAAKEVKRWGESVTLKPMNSHDRRLIHMALKEDSEVKTESVAHEDSNKLKSVIISLNEDNN